MKTASAFVQLWVGRHLPVEHIYLRQNNGPHGGYKILKVCSRKWLIHPLKRKLAKYYLATLRWLFGLKVIGVTGSAGKTSTKDMTASVLGRKGKTVASYKNIDPVYNIPTTIFKCRPTTKFLVLEMGVEYQGEMDFYCWLAKPDIGVITNIYPTHTQFFNSTQGVAKEKGKIAAALSGENYLILNKENIYSKQIAQKSQAKTIYFGKGGGIKAERISLVDNLVSKYTLSIGKSKTEIKLPVIGKQFVSNSLAAAAVGTVLGLSVNEIKSGLESFPSPEHRMKIIKHKTGALIIDDSYNNNPAAAKEALKTFIKVAGTKKKIVVFGDMLELGKQEDRYHKELGRIIGRLNVNYLIGVGPASKLLVDEALNNMNKRKTAWTPNWERTVVLLKPLLNKKTCVLIKGSRSIGLDRVVEEITKK